VSHQKNYYRRHLPHYQPAGATFHVVFRLVGTIPRATVGKLLRETQQSAEPCLADALEHQRHRFVQLEAILDAGENGPRWLARPEIAKIVHDAIRHRDGNVYHLSASCVMPNHVHMLLSPQQVEDESLLTLAAVLKSLKGYTAWRCNKALGRHGRFWQEESFDRVVRDVREFDRTVGYIASNPVKAGLVSDALDWPWTYVAI